MKTNNKINFNKWLLRFLNILYALIKKKKTEIWQPHDKYADLVVMEIKKLTADSKML